MPAVPSGERAIEDMPRYIRAAIGAEWDWTTRSICRNAEGERRVAWTCTPAERIPIGKSRYLGAELIAYAEATCELCPVQWECVRFAVQIEAKVGTWGLTFSDLEWLRSTFPDEADQIAFVNAADDEDIPVQEAIRRARTATC